MADTCTKHVELLKAAQVRLEQQDFLLSSMLNKPSQIGMVRSGPVEVMREVGTAEEPHEEPYLQFVASTGGGPPRIVEIPKKGKGKQWSAKDIKPGVWVVCTSDGAIQGLLPPEFMPTEGMIRVASRDQKEDEPYISFGTADEEIRIPTLLEGVKEGDRVKVSPFTTTVVEVVERSKKQKVIQRSSFRRVPWDEVGGVDEVKEELISILDMAQNASLYGAYGKKPHKGLLFHGAPGCGKTMLAKAVVTHLMDRHGSTDDVPDTAFIYMKGPEVLDKYVGEAERKIRDAFEKARVHKRTHGYQAVLFIDEADAILPRRGSIRSSDVDRTIVPMFLAEMDGLDDDGPFVLLATNRPQSLDEAVLREGRIDAKIEIPRPDHTASKAIFRIHMRNVPIVDTEDMDLVVGDSTDWLFSRELLKQRVSGSLIAGIVQRGIDTALRRDVENKVKKPTGVRSIDLIHAIDVMERNEAVIATKED